MPTQIERYDPSKLEPAQYPQDARLDAVKLGPSQTLARGTVLGKRTSSKLHYPYNNALTDGTETATCILQYDVATDANGKHYLGDSAVPSQVNLPHDTTPVYVAGTFTPADLTGWDSAAAADFQAKTLPSGNYRIP